MNANEVLLVPTERWYTPFVGKIRNLWTSRKASSKPLGFGGNGWPCESCGQWNGFQEDGSYSVHQKEQFSTEENIPPSYYHVLKDTSEPEAFLCHHCEHLLNVVVKGIAQYDPDTESEMIESIQNSFHICDKCNGRTKILMENVHRAATRKPIQDRMMSNLNVPILETTATHAALVISRVHRSFTLAFIGILTSLYGMMLFESPLSSSPRLSVIFSRLLETAEETLPHVSVPFTFVVTPSLFAASSAFALSYTATFSPASRRVQSQVSLIVGVFLCLGISSLKPLMCAYDTWQGSESKCEHTSDTKVPVFEMPILLDAALLLGLMALLLSFGALLRLGLAKMSQEAQKKKEEEVEILRKQQDPTDIIEKSLSSSLSLKPLKNDPTSPQKMDSIHPFETCRPSSSPPLSAPSARGSLQKTTIPVLAPATKLHGGTLLPSPAAVTSSMNFQSYPTPSQLPPSHDFTLPMHFPAMTPGPTSVSAAATPAAFSLTPYPRVEPRRLFASPAFSTASSFNMSLASFTQEASRLSTYRDQIESEDDDTEMISLPRPTPTVRPGIDVPFFTDSTPQQPAKEAPTQKVIQPQSSRDFTFGTDDKRLASGVENLRLNNGIGDRSECCIM